MESPQMFLIKTKTIFPYDFSHKQPAVVMIAERLHIKAFGHGKSGYRHELDIVLPLHDNIQIIIPRNKASMAHGPQQRSSVCKVLNIMFSAYSVHFQKHFQK